MALKLPEKKPPPSRAGPSEGDAKGPAPPQRAASYHSFFKIEEQTPPQETVVDPEVPLYQIAALKDVDDMPEGDDEPLRRRSKSCGSLSQDMRQFVQQEDMMAASKAVSDAQARAFLAASAGSLDYDTPALEGRSVKHLLKTLIAALRSAATDILALDSLQMRQRPNRLRSIITKVYALQQAWRQEWPWRQTVTEMLMGLSRVSHLVQLSRYNTVVRSVDPLALTDAVGSDFSPMVGPPRPFAAVAGGFPNTTTHSSPESDAPTRSRSNSMSTVPAHIAEPIDPSTHGRGVPPGLGALRTTGSDSLLPGNSPSSSSRSQGFDGSSQQFATLSIRSTPNRIPSPIPVVNALHTQSAHELLYVVEELSTSGVLPLSPHYPQTPKSPDLDVVLNLELPRTSPPRRRKSSVPDVAELLPPDDGKGKAPDGTQSADDVQGRARSLSQSKRKSISSSCELAADAAGTPGADAAASRGSPPGVGSRASPPRVGTPGARSPASRSGSMTGVAHVAGMPATDRRSPTGLGISPSGRSGIAAAFANDSGSFGTSVDITGSSGTSTDPATRRMHESTSPMSVDDSRVSSTTTATATTATVTDTASSTALAGVTDGSTSSTPATGSSSPPSVSPLSTSPPVISLPRYVSASASEGTGLARDLPRVHSLPTDRKPPLEKKPVVEMVRRASASALPGLVAPMSPRVPPSPRTPPATPPRTSPPRRLFSPTVSGERGTPTSGSRASPLLQQLHTNRIVAPAEAARDPGTSSTRSSSPRAQTPATPPSPHDRSGSVVSLPGSPRRTGSPKAGSTPTNGWSPESRKKSETPTHRRVASGGGFPAAASSASKPRSRANSRPMTPQLTLPDEMPTGVGDLVDLHDSPLAAFRAATSPPREGGFGVATHSRASSDTEDSPRSKRRNGADSPVRAKPPPAPAAAVARLRHESPVPRAGRRPSGSDPSSHTSSPATSPGGAQADFQPLGTVLLPTSDPIAVPDKPREAWGLPNGERPPELLTGSPPSAEKIAVRKSRSQSGCGEGMAGLPPARTPLNTQFWTGSKHHPDSPTAPPAKRRPASRRGSADLAREKVGSPKDGRRAAFDVPESQLVRPRSGSGQSQDRTALLGKSAPALESCIPAAVAPRHRADSRSRREARQTVGDSPASRGSPGTPPQARGRRSRDPTAEPVDQLVAAANVDVFPHSLAIAGLSGAGIRVPSSRRQSVMSFGSSSSGNLDSRYVPGIGLVDMHGNILKPSPTAARSALATSHDEGVIEASEEATRSDESDDELDGGGDTGETGGTPGEDPSGQRVSYHVRQPSGASDQVPHDVMESDGSTASTQDSPEDLSLVVDDWGNSMMNHSVPALPSDPFALDTSNPDSLAPPQPRTRADRRTISLCTPMRRIGRRQSVFDSVSDAVDDCDRSTASTNAQPDLTGVSDLQSSPRAMDIWRAVTNARRVEPELGSNLVLTPSFFDLRIEQIDQMFVLQWQVWHQERRAGVDIFASPVRKTAQRQPLSARSGRSASESDHGSEGEENQENTTWDLDVDVEVLNCRICEKLVPREVFYPHTNACSTLVRARLSLGVVDSELRQLGGNRPQRDDDDERSERSALHAIRSVCRQAAEVRVEDGANALEALQQLDAKLVDLLLQRRAYRHRKRLQQSIKAIGRKTSVLTVCQNAGEVVDSTAIHTSEPVTTSLIPTIHDFVIITKISEGAYGRVFMARKRGSGDVFAIKVLRKADVIRKNQMMHVLAEKEIMSRTDNTSLVRLFYAFQSRDNLYLVMEYLPGGDLAAILKDFGRFPEEWAKVYIAELIDALDYIHSKGIVHRDLKPDNLVIDIRGHMKLTDFGLSRFGLIDSHSHGQQQRSDLAHPLDLARGPQGAAAVREKLRMGLLAPGSSAPNVPVPPVTPRAVPDKESDSESSSSRAAAPTLPSLSISVAAVGDSGEVEPGETSPTNLAPGGEKRMRRSVSAHLGPSATGITSGEANKDPVSPRKQDLSVPLQQRRQSYARGNSQVGTPDYLAPEIILSTGHSFPVDWWAVGVILFEFLVGIPPFHADTVDEVFANTVSLRIAWPDEEDDDLSDEARDLIMKLLTIEPAERLGSRGAKELRAHPFFHDIDWSHLRDQPGPFVPKPSHLYDTKYFQDRGDPNAPLEKELHHHGDALPPGADCSTASVDGSRSSSPTNTPGGAHFPTSRSDEALFAMAGKVAIERAEELVGPTPPEVKIDNFTHLNLQALISTNNALVHDAPAHKDDRYGLKRGTSSLRDLKSKLSQPSPLLQRHLRNVRTRTGGLFPHMSEGPRLASAISLSNRERASSASNLSAVARKVRGGGLAVQAAEANMRRRRGSSPLRPTEDDLRPPMDRIRPAGSSHEELKSGSLSESEGSLLELTSGDERR